MVPPGSASSDHEAEPFDLARRPTLRSVDLEVVYDAERDPPPRSTIPPPLPARASRSHSYRAPIEPPPNSRPELQLLDKVVASLEDLTFFETMAEAASFCLVTAMQAVPSLGGLVLLREEGGEAGGYIVVYARGPRGHEVVRARVGEDDPAIGASLVRGGPVALEYGDGRSPASRHTVFGDPWTTLVVPVQEPQEPHRCLGSIELIDPIDGCSLGDGAREVLATIARRLVEFGHGRPERSRAVGNVFAPEQLGLED
jgi:hypothetical protein